VTHALSAAPALLRSRFMMSIPPGEGKTGVLTRTRVKRSLLAANDVAHGRRMLLRVVGLVAPMQSPTAARTEAAMHWPLWSDALLTAPPVVTPRRPRIPVLADRRVHGSRTRADPPWSNTTTRTGGMSDSES